MWREYLSKNIILKYKLKAIYRKIYLFKVNKKSLKQLMKCDAKLFQDRHGTPLDWNNLQTYSEKMQWAKLFDRDPRKTFCSDKLLVRKWVSDKIGKKYLIPLLGVWDNAKDINFDILPNQFVLKTNCSSGDTIIVKNKKALSTRDIKGYKIKLNYFLHMQFGYNTYELHYNDITPKILAETFIENEEQDLRDYKFLCFDGKVYYCWVDVGRYHQHERNIYNLNWELQPWNQHHYDTCSQPIERPENLEEMIGIAQTLSKGFSHVRVDLYNVNGKIYFGEMTFTNSSGLEKIEPEWADLMLGELWKVNTSLE